jgi:hypothetical protein
MPIYSGNASVDIPAFANTIYRAWHGIDNDVTGADLTTFLNDTIAWTNDFATELELEADWKYLRVNNNQLGIVSTSQTYNLDDSIRKPIYHPQRKLTIVQDGVVVSTWTLVDPDQIQTLSDYPPPNIATSGASFPNYAMVDNGVLTLSRVPYSYEIGGTIVADTIQWIPQLSLTDSTLLTTVTPSKILTLGVAKDQLPPDLVRGGIASLIETRYDKLLANAIQDNGGTSLDDESMPDDLSYIGGIYLTG